MTDGMCAYKEHVHFTRKDAKALLDDIRRAKAVTRIDLRHCTFTDQAAVIVASIPTELSRITEFYIYGVQQNILDALAEELANNTNGLAKLQIWRGATLDPGVTASRLLYTIARMLCTNRTLVELSMPRFVLETVCESAVRCFSQALPMHPALWAVDVSQGSNSLAINLASLPLWKKHAEEARRSLFCSLKVNTAPEKVNLRTGAVITTQYPEAAQLKQFRAVQTERRLVLRGCTQRQLSSITFNAAERARLKAIEVQMPLGPGGVIREEPLDTGFLSKLNALREVYIFGAAVNMVELCSNLSTAEHLQKLVIG
jgi:hypothetical protein